MKKMNNKGFSLVELIIVIAIMAILIAVLAPQFLRYVEKSRLQSDNSAIGEVANAVKVAAANDTINAAITDGITWTPSTTAATVSFGVTSLDNEIEKVCGSSVCVKSNTYKNGAPTLTVNIDSTEQTISVTASSYMKEVGGDRETITF